MSSGRRPNDYFKSASPGRPSNLSFDSLDEVDELSHNTGDNDREGLPSSTGSRTPLGGARYEKTEPSSQVTSPEPNNMLAFSASSRRQSSMNTRMTSSTSNCFHHNCISRSSSTESILDDISSRAVALFNLLDSQNVGYIGEEELATCCPDLSPEELSNLFNQLDCDGDGKISVRDFKEGFRAISRTLWAKGNERRKSRLLSTDGFSSHGSIDQLVSTGDTAAGGTGATSKHCLRKGSDPYSVDLNDMEVSDEMKGYLKNLSDGLSSLNCQEKVCELYHMLSTECPELVECYEAIVLEIIDQTQQQQTDLEKLEESFMIERKLQEDRFRMLESESDRQIKSAEERIEAEVRQKLQSEHKHTLNMKQQEILSLMAKVRRLEMQLEHMRNQQESDNEDEKVSLMKEQLKQALSQSRQLRNEITELQTALTVARSENLTLKQDYEDACRQLKREKASVATFAKEHDELQKEITMLREVNLQLNSTNDDLRHALEVNSSMLSSVSQEREAALMSQSPKYHRRASAANVLDQRPNDLALRNFLCAQQMHHHLQLQPLMHPSYMGPSVSPFPQGAQIRRRHPGDESISGASSSAVHANCNSYSCNDLRQMPPPPQMSGSLRNVPTGHPLEMDQLVRTHSQNLVLDPHHHALHAFQTQQQSQLATASGNTCFENTPYEGFEGSDSQLDDSGMSTLRDITEIDSEYSAGLPPNPHHSQAPPHRQGSCNSVFDATVTQVTLQSSQSHETLVNGPSSLERTLEAVEPRPAPQHQQKPIASYNVVPSGGNKPTNSRPKPPPLNIQHISANNVKSNASEIVKSNEVESRGQPTTMGSRSPNNKRQRQFKVVLAGDAAVGKSSFIVRVCDNKFAASTTATLGVDFRNKYVDVDDEVVCLQLWDTAGQERFRSMAKSHFRRGDGVLLLYDCTYEKSFLSVRDWIEDIKANARSGIPIVIVANKVDLREDQRDLGVRVIDYEEGRRLAQEYEALFLETSNKDGYNTLNVIVEMCRLLRVQEDIDISYCQNRNINLKNKDESADKGSTLASSCCSF